MKKVNLILILVFCTLLSKAQVSVTFLNSSEVSFSREQIWNVILQSTSQGNIMCYAEITLYAGKEFVASSRTSVFTFSGTKSMMGSREALNASTKYFQNETSQSFSTTGQLQPGAYRLCVRIMSANELLLLADECNDIVVSGFLTIHLIHPLNGEQITNPFPLLSWNVIPGGDYIYKLRLAILDDGQSPTKALRQNKNLLQGIKINTSNLNYPETASSLTMGNTYAWQVICFKEGKEILQSEVWTFNLIGSANRVNGPVETSYRKITTVTNPSPYLYGEAIRFTYSNIMNDPELHYSILDLTNGQFISGLPAINLAFGENSVDIPTAPLSLVPDRNYLISVNDKNNRSYTLSFIYVED